MWHCPQEVCNGASVAVTSPQIRPRPRNVINLRSDIIAHDITAAENLIQSQVEIVDANEHNSRARRAMNQNFVVNHWNWNSRGCVASAPV